VHPKVSVMSFPRTHLNPAWCRISRRYGCQSRVARPHQPARLRRGIVNDLINQVRLAVLFGPAAEKGQRNQCHR
jgi:hypothetical protein